ncbi:pleiotropic drug resistance protein ABC superfamily [Phytophthora cinnamomi]|uniref:pleiotropic drug resistance protein ABC superfamily n=2 Tax=Phytophthora cinnamomi TaxID=4785 RepID=UPI003559E31A|nr:pleiotropic drug resistance protein ABC superfamily [Phytophthora cinnamomi]
MGPLIPKNDDKGLAKVPPIGHDSGEALMAQGPLALHELISTRMQAALGQPLPQMEVRLHTVSISADVVVKDETNLKTELPTLTNTVKMAAIRMNAKKHIVTKDILRNVSGVLEPGTMTLVLGQPGSGKSSLLKMLGGRLSTDNRALRVDGEVT